MSHYLLLLDAVSGLVLAHLVRHGKAPDGFESFALIFFGIGLIPPFYIGRDLLRARRLQRDGVTHGAWYPYRHVAVEAACFVLAFLFPFLLPLAQEVVRRWR